MVFHIPAALHLYLEDIVVVFTLKAVRSDLYSVLSNIRTGPTDAERLPWSQANYPEKGTNIGRDN